MSLENFSRQASADLDEAVGWLLDGGGSARRAEQLLGDVQTAAEQLAARPSLGRRRLDLLPIPYRFWSLPRHRLLLVYTDATDPARILRVLHTARELGPLLAELRAASGPEEG